jgi:cytidylate kinase
MGKVRAMSVDPRSFPGVVTISATYGTGGSVLAPRLATRLGIPFVDRLISTDIAHQMATADEGLTDEERAHAPTNRFLLYMARLPTVLSTPIPEMEDIDTEHRVRRQVEAAIDQLANTSGGVLLGRAGAIVLAGHPRAFHVRLDAPLERRLQRAMQIEGNTEKACRDRLNETDKARYLYVKRLYGQDPANPLLYHMALDTTVVPMAAVVEIVARTARAFWEQEAS